MRSKRNKKNIKQLYMFRYRRYKPRRKYATKAKKTYKKKSVSRKVSRLSRAVRVMNRREEVKNLQYPIVDTGLTTYYNGNMGSGSTMRLIQLSANSSTLPIPQNATQSGRIGNKIQFVGGKIRLNFYNASYSATDNPYPQPCIVKIWLITRRDTAQGIPTSSLPYFFQSGSTAVSPTGYLQDDFFAVNKDLYRVYKSYRLKIGPSSNTGLGAASNQSYFSNNDFSLNKSLTINFTKYLIKNAKFNDSVTNEPVNRGLWLVMEALSATNTGLSPNQYPIRYLGEIDLRWKDT